MLSFAEINQLFSSVTLPFKGIRQGSGVANLPFDDDREKPGSVQCRTEQWISNQMPCLTFGEGGSGFAQRDHCFFRQKTFQETEFVVAAASLVIAPQGSGH